MNHEVPITHISIQVHHHLPQHQPLHQMPQGQMPPQMNPQPQMQSQPSMQTQTQMSNQSQMSQTQMSNQSQLSQTQMSNQNQMQAQNQIQPQQVHHQMQQPEQQPQNQSVPDLIPTVPQPIQVDKTIVKKEIESMKKVKNDKKKKEAIDSQAREIIFKVIRFFESEKQNRGYAFPVENVVKRACAATGLSESTIKRIKRDGLRAEATQTKMAGPKKRRVRKTKVQLDYYQLCALRGIVNGYAVRKEVPTLGKILAAAKHELQYRGGKESLRLILLNKLGIKFKKCEKKIKKPPEDEIPPAPAPQVPPMNHHMMPQVKPMDNQCVYTTMMHQVPPVSY